MNKLTPEVYKGLLELSETLPKLIKIDKNGKPLYRIETEYNGGRQYKRTKAPLMVNHAVNLIDIYKRKGDKGVNIYVNECKRLVKEHETIPTT